MNNENSWALFNRKALFGFTFSLAVAAHVLVFSRKQFTLAEVVETLLESYTVIVGKVKTQRY